MIIKKLCGVCQTEFETTQEIIDRGRGKFCSMPCYRISRKGQPAWNKGKPATWAIGNKYRQGKGNPNPHKMFSADNPKWKDDKVGYRALHYWVERQLGKPMKCDFCGLSDKNLRFHWANKSGNYLRETSDWIRLCPTCHKEYDFPKSQ